MKGTFSAADRNLPLNALIGQKKFIGPNSHTQQISQQRLDYLQTTDLFSIPQCSANQNSNKLMSKGEQNKIRIQKIEQTHNEIRRRSKSPVVSKKSKRYSHKKKKPEFELRQKVIVNQQKVVRNQGKRPTLQSRQSQQKAYITTVLRNSNKRVSGQNANMVNNSNHNFTFCEGNTLFNQTKQTSEQPSVLQLNREATLDFRENSPQGDSKKLLNHLKKFTDNGLIGPNCETEQPLNKEMVMSQRSSFKRPQDYCVVSNQKLRPVTTHNTSFRHRITSKLGPGTNESEQNSLSRNRKEKIFMTQNRGSGVSDLESKLLNISSRHKSGKAFRINKHLDFGINLLNAYGQQSSHLKEAKRKI